MSDRLDVKIKQKELVKKSNISNLVEKFSFKHKTCNISNKTELKAEQEKIVKLQTHNLSYFLGKNVFGDDRFQNMSVHQQTLVR